MIEALKSIKENVKETYLKTTQVYYNIAGNSVECNICHYKANKLTSDTWHRYCICPNCYSTIRHRLLVASLTYLDEYSFEKLIDAKRILHFAPEKKLAAMLRSRASEYKSADFFTKGYSYKGIDYNLDISNMDTVQDESVDCVIACDVLEHVPDHMKGIREIYRILKPGGYCILTVPQKDHLETTIEDLSNISPKERKRLFGQYDHLRIYGNDFARIVSGFGFDVTAVNEDFFSKELVEKFVLFPPIISGNPLATNYRKVFFCKK